jgi:hypothetical protein
LRAKIASAIFQMSVRRARLYIDLGRCVVFSSNDFYDRCLAIYFNAWARILAASALEVARRGPILLAQQEALDLAGRGLRQFSDKIDPARIFVRGKTALAEFAELGGERGTCGLSVFEDDEGLRLDQALLIEASDDGRSEASVSTGLRVTLGLFFRFKFNGSEITR